MKGIFKGCATLYRLMTHVAEALASFYLQGLDLSWKMVICVMCQVSTKAALPDIVEPKI